MGRIAVLPETVQNKIAAGEVIERPASVVKELVENSLDAGAGLAAVEMEEGGHRLIRVSDDGCGMDESDLVASLERHATSKIHEVEDIFRIATFGFRGEALPSIASVSRLGIVSCPEGCAEGRELLAEGGKLTRLSPAPPTRGTRIEVRDIFFNTPARRKFLRQPASENSQAGEVITRLALGNPQASFRLQVNGRITLAVRPASSQLERIGDIFGREAAERLVPFAREVAEGLSIHGFFAKPPRSGRNSRSVYILMNRRWIRYPALARTVADAFQGALPPREYPFAIINLDLDPARVDVNVHPAKEEVRFEREGLLLSGARQAILEALSKLASLPTLAGLSGGAPRRAAGTAPSASGQPRFSNADGSGRQSGLPPALGLSHSRQAGFARLDLAEARSRFRSDSFKTAAASGNGGSAPPRAGEDGNNPADGAEAAEKTTSPPDLAAEAPPAFAWNPGAEAEPASGGLGLGNSGQRRLLGQAGGRYILIDGPDGIVLVDPHALHERWNYDRLAETRRRGALAERLLLPLEMRLSPAEAAVAPEAAPLLAEHGFELECPEPARLKVSACPGFIPPDRLEGLLRRILADLGEAGPALQAARDRVLASLACRSSVLLGHHLPEEEMLELLDRFFNQGQLPTCPHGRPTAIRIGWDELARRFGR